MLSSINVTPIMPAYAIATGHAETSHAAAQILKQGGNAYDAILAAMMMSFVAEPLLSSPGGGGFMLAAESGQKPQVFNFFPNTPIVNPADLNPKELDFYPIHGDFGERRQEFHIGAAAAAVPTAVAGIYAIHEKLASLPLSTLAAPAIRAAQSGVVVNQQQAFVAEILQPITGCNPTAHKFFGNMKTGTVWKNKPLATFLDTLSKQDHDWFYQGGVAKTIYQDSKSILTAADFKAVKVTVNDALHLNIKGHNIYTAPAPSSGGTTIIRQLKSCMSHEANNKSRLDAMKATEGQRLPAEMSRGTSHLSVTDGQGNLASMTLSNGEGNGIVFAEHGFMLNNFLGEEDINPDGFFAWDKNSKNEGVPLRSMMAPSLIINEHSRMALGTGGSNRIKTTLFQVIHRICHGEDLKNAINAPRFHFEKGHLDIEHGFNNQQIDQLQSECPNHLLFKKPSLYFGGINAVQFGKQTLGYADFRRHGCGITGMTGILNN